VLVYIHSRFFFYKLKKEGKEDLSHMTFFLCAHIWFLRIAKINHPAQTQLHISTSQTHYTTPLQIKNGFLTIKKIRFFDFLEIITYLCFSFLMFISSAKIQYPSRINLLEFDMFISLSLYHFFNIHMPSSHSQCKGLNHLFFACHHFYELDEERFPCH